MEKSGQHSGIAQIEWQTVALITVSYMVWTLLLVFSNTLHPAVWVVVSAINITLFLSITHEIVHGHPTRSNFINSLAILLPIGWSFPYERFRDTHIEHHETDELTDPFDDPESWYLAHHDWITRSTIARAVLRFNNTLFGRMLIGPLIGLSRFYTSEISLIINDERQTRYLLAVWIKHLFLCGVLAWIVTSYSSVALWQLLVSIYMGHSFLLIRTFLEHQAAPDHSERTVIIEQICPIAALFLFNNYHFVHHDRPHIPWYQLPFEFRQNREAYLAKNGAYLYRSYMQIFRKYFFHAKEPVKHPFLRTEA